MPPDRPAAKPITEGYRAKKSLASSGDNSMILDFLCPINHMKT
jgi:hypothetical protein